MIGTTMASSFVKMIVKLLGKKKSQLIDPAFSFTTMIAIGFERFEGNWRWKVGLEKQQVFHLKDLHAREIKPMMLECPVCKALIQEEKLVPLYGRDKTQFDPRSKSYSGIDIPDRPARERPLKAPLPDPNQFTNNGFGFMGGFVPMAIARMGNFTLATAFGGLIPSLFNMHFHGFPDATVYGTTFGFPYGFHCFHCGHAHHGFPQPANQAWNVDNVLKNLLMVVGVFVILALIC
ncbi:hypothetical protein G4B88_030937 [Cannabis sativa]|uniref:E3 ubiquitin-protein ligase RMA n=1 Tax=Cannabis sativa TaxID=3483 RepID=A0A7J6DUE4_CANSA|nr:hypothetical protein G4B88_030937 [Cannabis sativa]